MFQAAARWMIRRNIRALNTGDYGPVLKMFAADATLAFPGSHDHWRDAACVSSAT